MRCAHPDWIFHRLEVSGPADALADFRAAAAGAGVAPWALDYDALEEDLVALLLAPGPERRGISLAGARILARQVRECVWEDHEAALAAVALGERGCPFDLHALAPVPAAVLRLGMDHPTAVAWMWANWGTTWHLRRVEAARPPPGVLAALPPGHDAALIRFVSADWSPWPVLLRCRGRWPALRFALAYNFGWVTVTEPLSTIRDNS